MAEKKREMKHAIDSEVLETLWIPPKPMGLARAIAKAGYATRAKAEEMVRSGRVKVAGKVNTDPATTVCSESDILLDEQPLLEVLRRYFAFHKPLKVVSAPSDPGGRRQIADFLPREIPGLNIAGRLDANTAGLMLVSNDSVWNCLAAGCSRLEKEYEIKVTGFITEMEIGIILAGMHLPSLGFIRPKSLQVKEVTQSYTQLCLIVTEGKNRQVRKLFNALRHDVITLRRTRIDTVKLGNLPAGKLRPLTREEVDGIRRVAQGRQEA
jgi:23S rRNA pseudouridine2605 synthase